MAVGALAAGCLDGLIRIWEVASGQCVTAIPAHDGNVWRVEFMPGNESESLVSIGADSLLRIWDTKTSKEIGGHACLPMRKL